MKKNRKTSVVLWETPCEVCKGRKFFKKSGKCVFCAHAHRTKQSSEKMTEICRVKTVYHQKLQNVSEAMMGVDYSADNIPPELDDSHPMKRRIF